MSILELTAVELGKKIKDKEITVVEATKAALEQIKAVEGDVHGYVSYDEESALKRAEEDTERNRRWNLYKTISWSSNGN